MKSGTAFSAVFFSAAAFIAIASPSAFAQQSGLVIVDIKAVAEKLARNAKVEASEIPLTVRAPVHVAAEVCGVSPDVLKTQSGQGGVSCAATTTSPALERLVRMRRRQQ